jgi:hypothetical protein
MNEIRAFTRADAEALGWTTFIVGDEGLAYQADAPQVDSREEHDGRSTEELLAEMRDADPVSTFSVTSGTPLFVVLMEISEREGVGFAQGHGGDQPITPELVLACSGETL